MYRKRERTNGEDTQKGKGGEARFVGRCAILAL